MNASKHHPSPITGTGKVVTLQTNPAVPVRMADKLLDSEACRVIPFVTPEEAGIDRPRSTSPKTDRPSADALSLGHGRGNISLHKASESAITRLPDVVRTANDQATSVWSHDRAWMAAELERAVEQDRLVLHYQPQYAIDTQRVVAVEALVRLVTESGELIGANDFIELAEETGQILQIGRWVIEAACQQLGRWQQAGLGMLRIAVNVSPCQLMANDFCALVDTAVASAGIRHSDLELEITECQLVENRPYVERTLRILTTKGVRVVVDGFGTGYSSLACLQQLSISTVKVDRVFISQITEDARAGRIVNLIIAMAQELGLGLIAVDVETEAQHRFLLESGCQLGQGYGFARPQNAADIERFLYGIQSSDLVAGFR